MFVTKSQLYWYLCGKCRVFSYIAEDTYICNVGRLSITMTALHPLHGLSTNTNTVPPSTPSPVARNRSLLPHTPTPASSNNYHLRIHPIYLNAVPLRWYCRISCTSYPQQAVKRSRLPSFVWDWGLSVPTN